ncbi:LapA family protein [Clostridium sp. Marseille-Q2269]|uniref:LapA family protein n=1 Tax=Clostridium sp. Marseille-Q2269 TaxID=2942205 RepID=UPI0020736A12|nr:LapA family protein [Clostridium sp. Marseille-Q2269]
MRNGFVFSLIMALIVAIFAIQNSTAIPVKILFWQIDVSLAIIILVSAVIGAVITGIMGIKKERGIKRQNKDLLNKIKESEENNGYLSNKLEKSNSDSKKAYYIKDSEYTNMNEQKENEK